MKNVISLHLSERKQATRWRIFFSLANNKNISKVGVTVNMPKLKLRTFASIDRNAIMTKEW